MNAFVTVYVARKIGRKRVITRDEFYTVRGALSRKHYRSMRSFETFLREKGRGDAFSKEDRPWQSELDTLRDTFLRIERRVLT